MSCGALSRAHIFFGRLKRRRISNLLSTLFRRRFSHCVGACPCSLYYYCVATEPGGFWWWSRSTLAGIVFRAHPTPAPFYHRLASLSVSFFLSRSLFLCAYYPLFPPLALVGFPFHRCHSLAGRFRPGNLSRARPGHRPFPSPLPPVVPSTVPATNPVAHTIRSNYTLACTSSPFLRAIRRPLLADFTTPFPLQEYPSPQF